MVFGDVLPPPHTLQILLAKPGMLLSPTGSGRGSNLGLSIASPGLVLQPLSPLPSQPSPWRRSHGRAVLAVSRWDADGGGAPAQTRHPVCRNHHPRHRGEPGQGAGQEVGGTEEEETEEEEEEKPPLPPSCPLTPTPFLLLILYSPLPLSALNECEESAGIKAGERNLSLCCVHPWHRGCAAPAGSCGRTRAPRGNSKRVPEPCPALGLHNPGLHIPRVLIPSLHNLGSACWGQCPRLHTLSLPILDIPHLHLSSPYPPPAFWGLYIPDLQPLWCSHARSPTPLAQHSNFPQSGSPTSDVSPIPDLSTASLLIPALPHSESPPALSEYLGFAHPSVTILGCCIPEKQVHKHPLWVRGQTGAS